ncbi:hypothetical protein BX666DRAFT_1881451 [Dichotomocladium elegans]|nr:hypothetical protein BX666DRAFT_1881451 [Dichotomocladium elegans]
MILREDIPTSDLPEVLYDVEDNDEESSLSSFGGSTCSNCANGEPCPHHPPQRHRLYNLKKDGNVLDSKRSTATGVLRSSEKFVRPPTISSLSSSLSVVVLPQRSLQYQQDQHRFSAFWYDGAQGRSGQVNCCMTCCDNGSQTPKDKVFSKNDLLITQEDAQFKS